MTPDTRDALRALRMQMFETLTMFNGVLHEMEADGNMNPTEKAFILGQSEADRRFRADLASKRAAELHHCSHTAHTPEKCPMIQRDSGRASDSQSGSNSVES